MESVESIKKQILAGKEVDREQVPVLWASPLEPLCRAADDLRRIFCGDTFDLCAIYSGKQGGCSEDCRYCAQSARYAAGIGTSMLASVQEIVSAAQVCAEEGVLRFSVVTPGRRLPQRELDQLCKAFSKLCEKECSISLCASLGLLSYRQFCQLREAGVTRYHNNLETSRRYFPQVCSTHSYEDKIETIRAAQCAGLEVCSGGIIGMGETREDRADLLLELRSLGVQSVPVNLLTPIPGTPFEHFPPVSEEEARRTVAVFRFLLPTGAIRMAGGRGYLPGQGQSVFCSGANAAITGGMLTTSGISAQSDRSLLKRLGFHPALLKSTCV